MDFKGFNQKLQEHITEMLKDKPQLFVSDIDKDLMWETYLDSFPHGTNEIYRERRDAVAKSEQKKKLLGILAKKQDSELENLSIEELTKQINEM